MDFNGFAPVGQVDMVVFIVKLDALTMATTTMMLD
jgi:hypothetical protein